MHTGAIAAHVAIRRGGAVDAQVSAGDPSAVYKWGRQGASTHLDALVPGPQLLERVHAHALQLLHGQLGDGRRHLGACLASRLDACHGAMTGAGVSAC